MSPKMTDDIVDLTMVDEPPGNTEVVSASSSLLVGGGPSGSDLSPQSPTKTQLKEAVEYLEEKVGQTQVLAEEYVQAKVHDIKQDTMAKAKHLLADQKAKFEQTAQYYEQVARDEVTAQVAHNKAELVSEAMSVIGERDQKIAATTSQLADLRSHLDQANLWAQAELNKASKDKSDASGALAQQKETIVKEAEEVMSTLTQNAESAIANLRARLATAEGDLVKVNAEKMILESDFQSLTAEAQRLDTLANGEQELTKQAYESSSLWEAQARMSEGKLKDLQEENQTLKQNNFAANLTASSSTAEAEQMANEAKTLLTSMVEANELLKASSATTSSR